MKKPEIVDVFGMLVPIEYKDHLIEEQEAEGTYCEKTRTITIDSSLEGRDFIRTFLHELGHAMSHRLGINQGIEKSTEEIVVENYATLLDETFIFKFR